jgi:hypothetical protein
LLGDPDWTVRFAAVGQVSREAAHRLLDDPEHDVRRAAWQRIEGGGE